MSLRIKNSGLSLGFIGLGAIGLPIAANLLRAGFSLRVHTRSRIGEKNKTLKGAQPCSSPKMVAKGCDVLLVCVSDEDAVEAVLFGSDGAESTLMPGKTVIDLSTISPSKAKFFAEKLARKNIKYIDAPVSGGTEAAKKGTLTIFLGTSEDSMNGVLSILKFIGSTFYPF